MPSAKSSLILPGDTKLGSGVYGTVYKVPAKRLFRYFPLKNFGEFVAVKVVKYDHLKNALQEVVMMRKAAKCIPGYVPRVYDYRHGENTLFIIMENLEGYRHVEPLSIEQYEKIESIRDRLRACGIIHGDLNFRNILFRGDDIKIIDFGLSSMGTELNTSLHIMVPSSLDHALDKRNLHHVSKWISKDSKLASYALHRAIKDPWPEAVDHIMSTYKPGPSGNLGRLIDRADPALDNVFRKHKLIENTGSQSQSTSPPRPRSRSSHYPSPLSSLSPSPKRKRI